MKTKETLSALGGLVREPQPVSPQGRGGDVTNDVTHDELVAGGEDQIPYLVDTDRGVTMYESDEIVDALETRYQ